MSLGVVMLVHDSLDRASQLARHWIENDCPVVLHVDRRVSEPAFRRFAASLAGEDRIRFCRRHRCDWGTFSIVEATQSGAETMLSSFPEARHVLLASGTCLPLRPVPELVAYLDERPRTNFIESVTIEDVPWTVGGLDEERFTLRFPFSWKTQRRLFDRYVALQRRLGVRRRLPRGVDPHLGSQWWCLTHTTLAAILDHSRRRQFDRFFRRVWIPDESYFQSLVRLVSDQIESRSLTLSKFDFQGKPHVFYDDHLQLLRRSDCFLARKIWPRADRLYDAFLTQSDRAEPRAEPQPAKIDRIFAKALERRTSGRPGLYMQSRFPKAGLEKGKTCGTYGVFQGFDAVFDRFDAWVSAATGARVHGHLFAPARAEFADGQPLFAGALTDSATLRDYNPRAFLTSLIWNTSGEQQAFLYGPEDRQALNWFMATDPNARLFVVTGAWAARLFHSDLDFATIRREAARLQKTEAAFLDILRSPHVKATVRTWTLTELIEAPADALQTLLEAMNGAPAPRLTEVPRMVGLKGFGHFLQTLKNQGMRPYLAGEYPVDGLELPEPPPRQKPYLVE